MDRHRCDVLQLARRIAAWFVDQSKDWQVKNGRLVPYTVPIPSAEQLLAQAQQLQRAVVGAACASAITGGFQSSALGKAYTYPNGQTEGVWDYRPHTAAQIQQVGTDGKAAIMACLTKNATLQAQIAAATDVASVHSITW